MYKSRHDWMAKVTHWELRKKVKFDHANKQNKYKPGNSIQKILWDFEIQTDHLIPARTPDQVIIKEKKENLPQSVLFRHGRSESETLRKPKERQVLGPCQRTKNVMEHDGDGDSNYEWCTRNGL